MIQCHRNTENKQFSKVQKALQDAMESVASPGIQVAQEQQADRGPKEKPVFPVPQACARQNVSAARHKYKRMAILSKKGKFAPKIKSKNK